MLSAHDALLGPTTAGTTPPVGPGYIPASGRAAAGRCHELELSHPFNFTGQCPIASAPNGLTAEGLPTGVQVVAGRHDEHTVLRVCAGLEAADLLDGRRPPPLQPPT